MTNSTVLKDSLAEAIVSDEIQLGGDGVKSILVMKRMSWDR